ncbi:putative zinc-binding metallopeptidase [Comamonas sp. GB3 AK4-5]|uniref:zinc-binding metallopeptidase family protein n=1 Tax=Comamonas sp. GB3 AK4-5 TaxID=3231487 RepID=UPI00351F4AE9
MRAFNCDHCGHLVFFDSVHCVHCGSKLAFVPELLRMVALRPARPMDAAAPALQHWQALAPTADMAAPARCWRMCANQALHQACNFSVHEDDPQALCLACRQTRWLPDLQDSAHLRRWRLMEDAKRQLFYTLARLRLTVLDGVPSPAYEFLADQPGQPPVITGHSHGTIVLNVAEADEDERTRRRLALHEPYRTLEGHLRHESGHFFWELLVRANAQVLERFRQLFGDERQDYAQALERHYVQGPAGPADWHSQHVSAYASAHPWEDWAETWAHYLHLVDLLETAASFGTSVTIPGQAQPQAVHDPFTPPWDQFDAMLQAWVPLTLLLNSLNRSLGQQDAYPFALSSGAMTKLRFVHELLAAHRRALPAQPVDVSA